MCSESNHILQVDPNSATSVSLNPFIVKCSKQIYPQVSSER